MDVSDSDQLLNGLNAGQCAAVTAPPGQHHLVLAGAGCGKTTVLTRRVAYLITRGVAPSAILALTFTRKAADEMAQRIAVYLHTHDHAPLVTTFHALALKILTTKDGVQTYFNKIGFTGTVSLCSEVERLKVLAGCSTSAERRRLRLHLLPLDAVLERISVFPEHTEHFPPDERSLLSEINSRLRAELRKKGLWGFSDLLIGVVRLFSENSDIVSTCSKQFSHILVDEFQDTNPVQVCLLHQLLGKKRHLFAVGDDDQAIYAFRGADIRPIRSFSTSFPGASVMKLETNYRSTPAILKKANKVFSDKDPCYRKVLIAGGSHHRVSRRPQVVTCANQYNAAQWISEKISSLCWATSLNVDDMAILFRTNASKETMMHFFNGSEGRSHSTPHFITVHKSKGLEFPVIFLCDMEETVFPSYQIKKRKKITSLWGLLRSFGESKAAGRAEDLSEERRLFYVAVTRAREYLFLLHVRVRDLHGRSQRYQPSRFLRYMR